MIVFLDFETRSEAEIKLVGGQNYVAHQSTELLCATALVVRGGRAVMHCWAPWPGPAVLPPAPTPPPSPTARRARPPELASVEWAPPAWEQEDPPTPVLAALERGAPIVGHNALGFDKFVWEGLGFPDPPGGWLDSMDRASRASLPRGLEQIGTQLYGRGKDTAGRKLMLTHSVPKRSRNEDRYGGFLDPSAPAVGAITRYCARDTLLAAAVWYDYGLGEPHVDDPVLAAHERIEARGVPIDLDFVRRLKAAERRVIEREVAVAAEALGWDPERVREVAGSPKQLVDWLAGRGVQIEDAKADTIEEILPTLAGSGDDVRAMLSARAAIANVVGGKLRALQNLTQADGRYRGWSSYHKAVTGRWTGRGAQMQNFPRAAD